MTRWYWYPDLQPAPKCSIGALPAKETERIAIEVVEMTPEEEALDAALADCGLTDPEQRDQVLCQLVEPPRSLYEKMEGRRGWSGGTGSHKKIKPDGDTLANMLRLDQGKFDTRATWKSLSRADRMAANRLWDWFGDLSDTSSFPQGRPVNLDYAIVLYSAFVLREAVSRRKLGYSTSSDGKRGGPFLRALMAALNAQLADERCQQEALDRVGPLGTADTPPAPNPEAVRKLLMVANSREFIGWAGQFRLALTAAAVADHPAEFRYLAALAARRRKASVTD
jgi:hypothetical protein